MKLFLIISASVCCLLAAVLMVAVMLGDIPMIGIIPLAVCLFGLWGSVESLSELYETED